MKQKSVAFSITIALILIVTLGSVQLHANAQNYIIINNNYPFFTPEDYPSECFEYYSPLDELGRCGYAMACVCENTMPTTGRGSISGVKPTGWHTITYPNIIPDRYLYNRCHLIGWQLTAENANKSNLITGTRFLNVEGMLPFENSVINYIKSNIGAHVLYRVTPIFEETNLLASGVLMEAADVETQGVLFAFCVYCPNIQPGIVIDYSDGSSYREDNSVPPIVERSTYIINISSGVIHLDSCAFTRKILEENKLVYEGDFNDLLQSGYRACQKCNPH